MPVETFANQPATTVTSGGTTAPSGGTVQTWTVASSGSFPPAATGATQFHVADTAAGFQSELIAVTNVSGTTWTVTRGAESTVPVAHTAGFTITEVVAAGPLSNMAQVFSVMKYGATGDGTTNDTTAIQAAITAAATGGDVYFPWTSTGYLCGALTLPPGVRLLFANNAFLTAPASLATSWITGTSAVHNGTAVIGGTFDATAVTGTGVTAVIDFRATTSCPNLEIRGNRIIKAPLHGIAVSEATYSLGMKWITGNSVEEHGVNATGFGIYADYIGNVLIDGNYVYTAGVDDNIELGHSGSAWLTINAHLRCTNNVVVGGQINFPFSHWAEIISNTVINNTIQNDTNTADHVTIADNNVLNATPASGYAGIRVAGSYAVITGNHVMVNTGNGIAGSPYMTGFTVSGNYVYSSYATAGGTGAAIYDGGSGAADNSITGNILDGVPGSGFNYAFNLGGTKTTVTGNAIHNGGCYDAIAGGGTYLRVTGNDLNYDNVFGPGVGANSVLRDNFGYNPVGVVTPAVPLTTVAVAAVAYDRVFYITTTAAVSVAISGGPTIVLPTAGVTPVRVPATTTLTPTYSSTAPTWVVEGE